MLEVFRLSVFLENEVDLGMGVGQRIKLAGTGREHMPLGAIGNLGRSGE
jgi:hypothetical protein